MRIVLSAWLVIAVPGLSGCVPGGVIVPVPLPHVDRPMVYGTMLKDGHPLAGAEVRIKTDAGGVKSGCEQPDFTTITNRFGEFELPADRSFWTVFWTYSESELSVCISGISETAVWNERISIANYPLSSAKEIELTCNVVDKNAVDCATSLHDKEMPNCTDDIDIQYPDGGIDVKTGLLFTGRCVDYYDDGALLERSDFINGIRVGPSIAYFESGNREYQNFYIDGRRRRTTVWYENGRMLRQTHLRSTTDEKGRPVWHGLHTLWTEGGTLELQACWKDGVETKLAADSCWFD